MASDDGIVGRAFGSAKRGFKEVSSVTGSVVGTATRTTRSVVSTATSTTTGLVGGVASTVLTTAFGQIFSISASTLNSILVDQDDPVEKAAAYRRRFLTYPYLLRMSVVLSVTTTAVWRCHPGWGRLYRAVWVSGVCVLLLMPESLS